ncbi:MAG TPA: zinc-binding dehydrogenase, partial [Vicinamibacterales bacterium]|nr:zinc-binding dehydrogenase [Vicinamibacterales bacterium]
GRLGNLCAQVLRRMSSHVTVIGKHSEKLALLESAGVRTTLLADVDSSHDFDVVVDCTGSPTGLPTALSIVRPQGTIVLKTTVAGEHTMAWAPVVIDEISIIGSRCGPFERALRALETGEVDVLPLISARYSLSEGLAALEHAQSKPALKVLIDVE